MVPQTGTQELGRVGEQIACDLIRSKGWAVIERNWRCPRGEIDIVASDRSGVVVFIEVKCRSGVRYGDPLEAVTHAKLTKLRELAYLWLDECRNRPRKIRIDAIGVVIEGDGRPQVRHVEGITR